MEWHTGEGPCQSTATHGLSKASSTRSPGSPVVSLYLWRRSWGHPEWCRMMPFYGGLVYTGGVLRKHTHTHTRTAADTSMQMQTNTDWWPTAGLIMRAAHMQSIHCTCKGSMHPVIPDAVEWHCADCRKPLHYFSQHKQQQAFSSNAVWIHK